MNINMGDYQFLSDLENGRFYFPTCLSGQGRSHHFRGEGDKLFRGLLSD